MRACVDRRNLPPKNEHGGVSCVFVCPFLPLGDRFELRRLQFRRVASRGNHAILYAQLSAEVIPYRAVPAYASGALPLLGAAVAEPRPLPSVLDEQADIIPSENVGHHPNLLHRLRDGHCGHLGQILRVVIPNCKSGFLSWIYSDVLHNSSGILYLALSTFETHPGLSDPPMRTGA